MTKSFMGEHELKKPATVGEIRVMGTALMDAIQANRPAGSTPATTQLELTLSGAITMPPSGDAAAASTARTHQQLPYSRVDGHTRTNVDENAQLSGVEPGAEGPQRLQPTRQWVYVIPDLGRGEWKKAIEQWYHGDASIQLQALRDWPAREWQGRKKKRLGTKRRIRELIAQEHRR